MKEKEQTYKIFYALRVCSFCRYKGLCLAHKALSGQMLLLALSSVFQILR